MGAGLIFSTASIFVEQFDRVAMSAVHVFDETGRWARCAQDGQNRPIQPRWCALYALARRPSTIKARCHRSKGLAVGVFGEVSCPGWSSS